MGIYYGVLSPAKSTSNTYPLRVNLVIRIFFRTFALMINKTTQQQKYIIVDFQTNSGMGDIPNNKTNDTRRRQSLRCS
jgi:hypothetical protein